MTVTPRFSVVVPVWHPDPGQFQEAVDSVFVQTASSWQLVLVADGPQPDEVLSILSEAEQRSHGPESGEVVVIHRDEQGGIVAASNDAIDASTGEFVAFLDNDDLLAPGALAAFESAADAYDDVDVIYSDEDKMSMEGRRVDPFHKPSWSPDRLRCQMYLGHLCAYRRTLVNEVGNLRQEFHGSQDHDLALRVTEKARRVTHIPQVLYHWRQALTSTALDPANKDWAFEAGVRAVQSHLDRVGIEAEANRDRRFVGVTSVDPVLSEHPLVSIVILTGGTRRIVRGQDVVMVTNAIKSVVARSTYPNYEILVVIDAKSSDALGDELRAVGGGRVRVVRDTRPFSFAASNNLGVSHAYGDHIVFLNDDTEVLTVDWMERLVMWSSLEGVGAVGCLLEYPDGRIQHAGVFSRRGGPSHRYHGFNASGQGAFGVLGQTINLLAVTGACLAIKREVFDEIGGFCTHLPLNFNDVDLCLKTINAGYRNVLDHRTRLVHLETSTRPKGVEAEEVEFMLARWDRLLNNDPWDNPNLDGVGVEEIPPPASLTARRELVGEVQFAARSWPSFSQLDC